MGSPETCPVCEDFAAACRHPAHYATPPAPADDATRESASEAMRAEFDAWWDAHSDGYKRSPGKGADLSGVAFDAWQAARALPLPAAPSTDEVEVERDAARFRWLMERNFGFAFDAERCGIATGRWGPWPEAPDEQRAMIDRAIAYYAAKAAAERAERGGKGGGDGR